MHVFWITSRAAGLVALLASSAAVFVGLMIGSRLRGRDLRTLHEALSLATLVALGVHVLALLGDSYLRPSLLDLTVPFVSSYQRVWTAAGIVAGWGLVILGLSFYARAWIGVARWRLLHRFTALAWALAVVHALLIGSDAGAAWFLLAAALAVLPVGALLARRLAVAT